jgi:hypothetical protein
MLSWQNLPSHAVYGLNQPVRLALRTRLAVQFRWLRWLKPALIKLFNSRAEAVCPDLLSEKIN